MTYTRKVIVIFIAVLCFYLPELHSQNKQVKFITYTVVNFSQVSLSYEHNLNENHSIGMQINNTAYFFPFLNAYPATPIYISSGMRINYRYYKKFQNRNPLFFFQADAGILTPGWYNLEEKILAFGGNVGLRNFFGNSEKWFIDYVVGLNYLNSQGEDFHFPTDWGFLEPRIMVEVGVKF